MTVLVLTLLAWVLPIHGHTQSAAQATVFTNAHIAHRVDGQWQMQTGELLVVGERIAESAAQVSRPPGARILDAGGGYLIPGLAEMHAHVPVVRDDDSSYRDDVLFLWLAHGITTVRGMLGHPQHLQLRADLAAGAVRGPRLITSGPSFNGRSVQDAEGARRMVREQHAAGYDFLKIHPGVPPAAMQALADEARRVGMTFGGHVPADTGLHAALDLGQRSIDHLDGYVQALVPDLEANDPGQRSFFGVALMPRVQMDRVPAVIAATAASGTWMVPTETLFENFADADNLAALTAREDYHYLPPDLRDRYRRALSGAVDSAPLARENLALRKALLGKLHAAGVGILLGSDSPQIFNVPGFSIHRELQSMVAAGLTPGAALAAGTVAPAHYFALPDVVSTHTRSQLPFGLLAPGMAADVVMLRDNPLTDILASQSIVGVMARGWWLDAAARKAGLAAIRQRYATADTAR